ncbi:MAG: riboflavin synthase [candidate division WOR-3 bacterium]|nr:riboflavin synthase [candidate division WOR-3 bacterium]MCX7836752.1 riboflavin synthase [candidate division WOR-3 bacterium]MDW8114385.1 riboflavin synthase [candidate division WOR-3 bacterium]
MFKGIISEVGKVYSIINKKENKIITIQAKLTKELDIGSSVAVDGVCLTVIEKDEGKFSCEVIKETLRNTTLKNLRTHSYCNLELPMKISDRIDGHILLGHIDEIGKIVKFIKKESYYYLEIKIRKENKIYLVKKGSIAINGVSLTIQEIFSDSFLIYLIPFTYENTNFKYKKVNDEVNIEYDYLGKYVLNKGFKT